MVNISVFSYALVTNTIPIVQWGGISQIFKISYHGHAGVVMNADGDNQAALSQVRMT